MARKKVEVSKFQRRGEGPDAGKCGKGQGGEEAEEMQSRRKEKAESRRAEVPDPLRRIRWKMVGRNREGCGTGEDPGCVQRRKIKKMLAAKRMIISTGRLKDARLEAAVNQRRKAGTMLTSKLLEISAEKLKDARIEAADNQRRKAEDARVEAADNQRRKAERCSRRSG